jgi:hypothetical protein
MLGSLTIYSYTLRLIANTFFVFPLVFQRSVAIRSKFTRRGSPVGFISFDLLGERKEFDTVVAYLPEMLEGRVAGACRSRWPQKVRHEGCLLGLRNDVGPGAVAPQGKVVARLSVPNNWPKQVCLTSKPAASTERECFACPLRALLWLPKSARFVASPVLWQISCAQQPPVVRRSNDPRVCRPARACVLAKDGHK